MSASRARRPSLDDVTGSRPVFQAPVEATPAVDTGIEKSLDKALAALKASSPHDAVTADEMDRLRRSALGKMETAQRTVLNYRDQAHQTRADMLRNSVQGIMGRLSAAPRQLEAANEALLGPLDAPAARPSPRTATPPRLDLKGPLSRNQARNEGLERSNDKLSKGLDDESKVAAEQARRRRLEEEARKRSRPSLDDLDPRPS